MQAQTHAKPRLCQLFEEKRVGEGDHNEYLKPFIEAALEKHRLLSGPSLSVLRLLLFPSSPWGRESAEVCRFLKERTTRPGQGEGERGEAIETFTAELCQKWRGPDLVQDALVAPLMARISKKTKGTPQLLDLRLRCSEWGKSK